MRVGELMANVKRKATSGKDELCVPLAKTLARYGMPQRYVDPAEIAPDLQKKIRGLARGKLPWPLFLHGEAGSGKTCAALCMLDEYGGRFVEYADLCNDVRLAMQGELFTPVCQGTGGRRMYEADIWQPWSLSSLTVLDDFGTRQPSAFQYEVLLKAIKTRYAKPAVFISNLSLEQIDTLYDDRVASRLSEGTIVETKGDRRGKKVGRR